jgi:hypothetical protein
LIPVWPRDRKAAETSEPVVQIAEASADTTAPPAPEQPDSAIAVEGAVGDANERSSKDPA